MASLWHYAKGDVLHGPITAQRLKELAASGELLASDRVCKDGQQEWRPASTLKGLFPEPQADQWHYAKGGVQHGPVTAQRLKELAASGELASTDLVWKEGLPEWRPASTLKGLFLESPVRPAAPPPLPPTTPQIAAEDRWTTRPRKPNIFDKAMGLAQRATKTMATAKANAESYQTEAPPPLTTDAAGVLPTRQSDAVEIGAAKVEIGTNEPLPSPVPKAWGAPSGCVGCLGILGVLALIGFILQLFGGGEPERAIYDITVHGDTATVVYTFGIYGSKLYQIADDVGTGVFLSARKHPEVKRILVVLKMWGAYDQYGKGVDVYQVLGPLERDADEVRKYASGHDYLKMQRDLYQVEILSSARENGRGLFGLNGRELFSDWKVGD